MANIPLIDIFPGINDLPTESTLTEGCNGSAIVQRVNSLIGSVTKPTTINGDCTAEVTLFVDTVNGLDTNTGLTTLAPLRTVQKAIDIYSSKRVDDCWWTYIRIKGTVTGDLDFTNIHGAQDNFLWAGTLILGKWGSETANWVYSVSPWANSTEYGMRPAWGNEGTGRKNVSVENCTFNNASLITFYGIGIYYTNCTFNNLVTNGGGTLVTPHYLWSRCPVVNFSACTINFTDNSGRFYVDNSYLEMAGALTFLGSNYSSGNTFFRLFRHSVMKIFNQPIHNQSGNGNIRIWGDETAIVRTQEVNENHTLGLQFVTGSWFGSVIYGQSYDSFSQSFLLGNVANGEYLLCFPNKPCNLRSFMVSGASGSATFQVKLGTANIGSPRTVSFTGIRAMSTFTDVFASSPQSLSSAFAVVVSGATSPVNVFLQLNFQSPVYA